MVRGGKEPEVPLSLSRPKRNQPTKNYDENAKQVPKSDSDDGEEDDEQQQKPKGKTGSNNIGFVPFGYYDVKPSKEWMVELNKLKEKADYYVNKYEIMSFEVWCACTCYDPTQTRARTEAPSIISRCCCSGEALIAVQRSRSAPLGHV